LSYKLSYADDMVAVSPFDTSDVPASRIFMFAVRRGKRGPKRLGHHWKRGYVSMEDLGSDDDPEDWTSVSHPYRSPFVALQMRPETYRTLDTLVPSFWGDSSIVFQSTRWDEFQKQFDVFNNRMFQDFADRGKRVPPRVMPLLLNPFLVLWAQLDSIVATFSKSLARHRAILAERAEHFADVYGFINGSASVRFSSRKSFVAHCHEHARTVCLAALYVYFRAALDAFSNEFGGFMQALAPNRLMHAMGVREGHDEHHKRLLHHMCLHYDVRMKPPHLSRRDPD
jgi:hypothetical protein